MNTTFDFKKDLKIINIIKTIFLITINLILLKLMICSFIEGTADIGGIIGEIILILFVSLCIFVVVSQLMLEWKLEFGKDKLVYMNGDETKIIILAELKSVSYHSSRGDNNLVFKLSNNDVITCKHGNTTKFYNFCYSYFKEYGFDI